MKNKIDNLIAAYFDSAFDSTYVGVKIPQGSKTVWEGVFKDTADGDLVLVGRPFREDPLSTHSSFVSDMNLDNTWYYDDNSFKATKSLFDLSHDDFIYFFRRYLNDKFSLDIEFII